MERLNHCVIEIILEYLTYEELLDLRLICKEMRDCYVPNAISAIRLLNLTEEKEQAILGSDVNPISFLTKFNKAKRLELLNFTITPAVINLLEAVLVSCTRIEVQEYIRVSFNDFDLQKKLCECMTKANCTKSLGLMGIAKESGIYLRLKVLSIHRPDFFSGIKSLNLSSSSFESFSDLKELLKLFPKVKELNLTGLSLGEDVVELIGDICPKTESLILSLNGLTPDVCKGLHFVFPPKLHSLNLSENWIGLHGILNMKKWFIESGHLLQCLNLENNKLFKDGDNTTILAEALSFCPNLQRLFLGINTMDDEDMKKVTSSICAMKKLKELNLCANLLTAASADNICLIMNASPFLEILHLSHNLFEDAGAAKIFSNFHNCASLTFVNLSGNRINGESMEALSQFLKIQYTGSMLKLLLLGNMIKLEKKNIFINTLKELRHSRVRFAFDIHFKKNCLLA